ncbi:MAG: AMP-binding protein [Candidatus Hodarchaeota archaeon]
MVNSERIWKRSWDKHITEIDPKEWDISYPDSIKQTFKELPNKVALAFLGVEITFGKLNKYANQFANMLIDKGFQKGDIVAINLANIPEYVIAMIGALRVGCTVSGVSPLLSPIQMQYQLNDLGSGGNKVALVTLDAIFEHKLMEISTKILEVELVITTNVASFLPKIKQVLGKLIGKIPKGKVTRLKDIKVIDFHKNILAKYSSDPVNVEVHPDDIAFIQYTGGTTGPPKGAVLTHRNIVSDLIIFQRWLNWEFGKGVGLSGFPFFHIAGVFTCLNVVYLGWSQILIPNPRDSKHICMELAKYQPSVLANVPSLYQIMLRNPKFRKLDHSKLEYCVSAAAPFPLESQKEFESIIGKGKIIEAYGMTETSPLTVSNPSRGKKKLGSIGLPLNNMDLKLVDPETGEEVPLGEAGEICIKGPMVMKGYLNKPEETKKTIDSDGYIHTGDVAIMDEEGYLKIVDRTKDMIIVGGYKVFSSKLEDVLSEHPSIGMIATIGLANPERPGSEIVKAFIQLDPDYEYDGNEKALKTDIINFAQDHCAPYEVPKIIEIVEELPLTAIGKIDKKVLRTQK